MWLHYFQVWQTSNAQEDYDSVLATPADMVALKFLSWREKKLLRLRKEGGEDNGIMEAELTALAERDHLPSSTAPTVTVLMESACVPSPFEEELRVTALVSYLFICILQQFKLEI